MIAAIFAKSYSPDQVAFSILRMVLESSQQFERSEASVHEIAAECGVPIERLTSEIMLVRILAADFAFARYLPNPPREAVRDAFLKWFARWGDEAAQRGVSDARSLFGSYGVRAQAYGPAINAMKKEDPPGTSFGDTFAAFCGADDDAMVAMLGFREFAVMQRVVADSIKDVKIEA